MKCISAFLSLCLIAAFVVAQPNYDFSKLKREHLGRGDRVRSVERHHGQLPKGACADGVHRAEAPRHDH